MGENSDTDVADIGDRVLRLSQELGDLLGRREIGVLVLGDVVLRHERLPHFAEIRPVVGIP